MRISYSHLHDFTQAMFDCSDDLSTSEKNILKYICGLLILKIPPDKAESKLSLNRFFFDAIGISGIPKEWGAILENRQRLTDLTAKAEVIISRFERKPEHYPDFWRNKKSITLCLTEIQLEKFSTDGFLIVENCLEQDFCDRLIGSIDTAHEKDKIEGVEYNYLDNLAYRVYHLIHHDPVFQHCLTHPIITQLMNSLFDRATFYDLWFLASFHANILRPGAPESIWHIDSAVPEPIPKWPIRGNVNLILHDYTQEIGATQVIPRSHVAPSIPPRTGKLDPQLVTLEAPKGSLVFWDGRLWHRSGSNQSERNRYALLGCFCSSIFRELSLEENVFQALPALVPENREIERIIGWHHGLKR